MHPWSPLAHLSFLSQKLCPALRSPMAVFIGVCFLCVASHAWAQQGTLAWDPVPAPTLGTCRTRTGAYAMCRGNHCASNFAGSARYSAHNCYPVLSTSAAEL